MKILPVAKVREADAFTIENEPIKSIDLMERAAMQCYRWIKKHSDRKQEIVFFCGPGNNGGDGLVVARLLSAQGYAVQVYIVRFTKNESSDFSQNLKRLESNSGIKLSNICESDPLPEIKGENIVVDAIFGSGLSRPVQGFTAQLISHINKSGAITIAIDTPSGLYSDKPSGKGDGAIIEADYTLSFQFPKFAFLFPENDKYVGEWHVLPIGLMEEFIQGVDVENYFVEKEDAIQLIKPRNKYAHKGNYGHALLIAGSYGKMGAAIMASGSALRSGAGLLTAHVPQCGYPIIQTALPEAMVSVDDNEKVFSKHPDLSSYNVIAVGPGLGKNKASQQALKLLIQNARVPLLFDADAINILGANKTWISFVPAGSIFTPHPGEFERLAGKSSNHFERNKMQRDFSVKHRVYVVLKGAHTCISTPENQCFFNNTGNPGMASGGSGDVLTGIILGLLAQNYHPQEACILGVYLHGLAGDLAARRKSQAAMIARDITANIGRAYKKLI